jgi:hypothetical protein
MQFGSKLKVIIFFFFKKKSLLNYSKLLTFFLMIYKVSVQIMRYLSYLFVFILLHENMLKNNHQLNFPSRTRMIFHHPMKNQAFRLKLLNIQIKSYYYLLHLLFIYWETIFPRSHQMMEDCNISSFFKYIY